MSSPCFKCGARPNVDCAHRPADPEWTPYDATRHYRTAFRCDREDKSYLRRKRSGSRASG